MLNANQYQTKYLHNGYVNYGMIWYPNIGETIQLKTVCLLGCWCLTVIYYTLLGMLRPDIRLDKFKLSCFFAFDYYEWGIFRICFRLADINNDASWVLPTRRYASSNNCWCCVRLWSNRQSSKFPNIINEATWRLLQQFK